MISSNLETQLDKKTALNKLGINNSKPNYARNKTELELNLDKLDAKKKLKLDKERELDPDNFFGSKLKESLNSRNIDYLVEMILDWLENHPIEDEDEMYEAVLDNVLEKDVSELTDLESYALMTAIDLYISKS